MGWCDDPPENHRLSPNLLGRANFDGHWHDLFAAPAWPGLTDDELLSGNRFPGWLDGATATAVIDFRLSGALKPRFQSRRSLGGLGPTSSSGCWRCATIPTSGGPARGTYQELAVTPSGAAGGRPAATRCGLRRLGSPGVRAPLDRPPNLKPARADSAEGPYAGAPARRADPCTSTREVDPPRAPKDQRLLP